MNEQYENIPTELQDRPQWLLWDRSNNTPKQPHWRGTFSISWSDPDDWHTFEEAVEAASERESWGIGYVMAQNNSDYPRGLYSCLDLDGCLKSRDSPKEWLPSLQDWIDDGAYIEVSPSGDGLHIPLVGQDIPDWWTDSHRTAEEHEGVDVLSNKFCTFSGDTLGAYEHEGVSSVDPTPWLHEAYHALNGEWPRTEAADDAGGSYDEDDEWPREEIEDALNALSSDCAYPMWRDIGFAVHDWDDGHTGRSLFEQWSRGPGWDETSDRYIEQIWANAEPGSGVTVGTLIHHAMDAGWSPSRSSPSLDAADTDDEEEGTADADDGEPDADIDDEADGGDGDEPDENADADPLVALETNIRDAIRLSDTDEIQVKTARHRIARAFYQTYNFVYPEESVRGWRSVLHVFDPDEGVYEPRGRYFVKKRLEQFGGDFVTNQVATEIVTKVERMAFEGSSGFGTNPERLVVGNGILNLHTGELDDYTPTEYHRTKIDTDWNPDAGDPDAIDDFFHDIVDGSDVPTLYRIIAHSLYKEYVTEKAAMLIGSGENGKSVFLDFVERFLHGENVTHRALQDFDDNHFAASQLEGKLANVHPDMGDGTVTDLSVFKKLTGQDTMLADVKYENPIKFENHATLMFAANEMPVFREDNHAVWRRWLYLDFPYTFNANDPDAKEPEPKRAIMNRLTDDEQLEALLLRCQQEIQEWYADGREWFASAMQPSKVREKMKKAAEPVYNFASACLTAADSEEYVDKATVRECYRRYADEEDLPNVTDHELGEELFALRDLQIESERKRDSGGRINVYSGIALSSRGRQIMELDESDDDGQAGVDTDWDSKKPIVLEELHEMVEQNGGEPVARNAVVWRCAGKMGKTTAERVVEKLLSHGEIMVDGDCLIPV